MITVVDVSSAVEIILQKEKFAQFNEIIKESSWVIAPDLYIPELTNVFWKYPRGHWDLYTPEDYSSHSCIG